MSFSFTFVVLSFLFFCTFAQKFSIIKKGDSIEITKGAIRGSVAWGSYENTVNSTGWGILNIHTNKKYSPEEQAFAAGYIESYLTHQWIWIYWQNYKKNEYKHGINKNIRRFMSLQFNFWRKHIKNNENDDVYWKNQKLIFEQFRGLWNGYKKFGKEPMTLEELYLLNSVGDLPTITDKFEKIHSENSMLDLQDKNPDELYHECSAYVKYNNKSHDIIFSHNTWRPYYAMLRIYKHYFFPWTKNAQPMSFASSPGLIHSKDDFYLLSNAQQKRFGVMETTNSFFFKKLNKLITPNSLLSWQRILVSMYFGQTPKEITKTIGQFNSGTYNNQWMIINLNSIEKNAQRKKNILYIGEQMPGKYIVKDVTPILINQTYWASYNIPYIKEIFVSSGYLKKMELGKKEYNYTGSSRALIFTRDGARIHSIDDVKKLMTMNHYKTDPISNKPRNQIAARYDLEIDSDYKFPFGAVDCKIGAASLKYKTLAYCGPTHEGGLPPFNWELFPSIQHWGTPRVYNFDWVKISPSL
ncbi:phospholipase B, putative [Entamoeba histolytica HM-1:IMSS-B]|uniref:Phospholipase B-like n=6 Tax=Entamoeba histolytica TaxID=5759 RepID=C4M0I5_ENTH1|nr:hypothetical protein, conserved [Entamoeba histolytica HM-1:IMSS]EMD44994.1 phospholipase, putative [Entamoeba histolytica KU27]EMH75778.1 phospholipase B, putative [Entamoeba histolytica HM-1:IMSS-B]ENY65003.1 phospholipase B protein, putative [Entamoeba histolytica HM-1:IMSS-A]GAT94677.1 phospholipase b putative [Entamoeba histolytica]EAL45587.1 hypothetical protein, conserved [Entamoeba histolytica HM-1:IMSS]|eukprot:XP_650973.1 hypothetical protein, conserved [Entamoeba histolytica HM-1:IMSS]